jgi:hypothetical protein
MINVIVGAPCSGKSTYAQNHAKPDDAIIDFDIMAVALGSNVDHGHSEYIVKITLAAWMAAIRESVANHYFRDIWIVDGRPTLYRQRLYNSVKANFIGLRVDKDELHSRASFAHRPDYYHELIDQCF